VTRRGELDAAVARVGFPLVMKIQSRDHPDKSEVAGVRVNITTKGEAFAAYLALLESAQRRRSDAAIQGSSSARWRKKVSRSSSARCRTYLRRDDHGRSCASPPNCSGM